MNEKPSILVIDDDPDLCAIYDLTLSEEFSLLIASDGYKGLNLAQKHNPDIIILDIFMPIVNGYEILDQLQKLRLQSKVIVITQAISSDHIVKQIKLGAVDHISKPFEPEELLNKVKRALVLADKPLERGTVVPINNLLSKLQDININRNRLEPKLRQFVKNSIQSQEGPDRWIDKILDCIPQERRAKLQGVDKNEILNSHIYFQDLISVIYKQWDKYFKAMEATVPQRRITKNQINILLDFVNAHRHDAHAKDVSEAEMATLSAVFWTLEASLDNFLGKTMID